MLSVSNFGKANVTIKRMQNKIKSFIFMLSVSNFGKAAMFNVQWSMV